MQFKSLRPYPITLTNPNGQTILLYPGQSIELPEEFGLKFNGLLIPSQEQVVVAKKTQTFNQTFTNPIEKKVEKVEEVVDEMYTEEVEEVSPILLETLKLAKEKKEGPPVEVVKKKAGRPKKEK